MRTVIDTDANGAQEAQIQMQQITNQLVSVAKAAAMLDCSPETVRRIFRDRTIRISPRRVGVKLSDLNWLTENGAFRVEEQSTP